MQEQPCVIETHTEMHMDKYMVLDPPCDPLEERKLHGMRKSLISSLRTLSNFHKI